MVQQFKFKKHLQQKQFAKKSIMWNKLEIIATFLMCIDNK